MDTKQTAQRFPLSQSEDSPIGHSRDRQLWTMSMRGPLANKQRATEQQRIYNNKAATQPSSISDSYHVIEKMNDLSMTHNTHGCVNDTSKNAAKNSSNSYCPCVPGSASNQWLQTPHRQDKQCGWQRRHRQSSENRKNSARSVSIDQRGGITPTNLLANAPFLPCSPDLSVKDHSSIRFPRPMFSPIAGTVTEFRIRPELIRAATTASPERSTAMPRQPLPLIPRSPELEIRSHRALKMRKIEQCMEVVFS